MTDEEREQRIKLYYSRLVSAETRTGRVLAWEAMRALIMNRSPQQVERMVKTMGLDTSA